MHGMPGVRWEQGGILFAAEGSPVTVHPVEPGPQLRLELEPEDEPMPVLNQPDLAEPIELLPYAEVFPSTAVPASDVHHTLVEIIERGDRHEFWFFRTRR